jgi:hypothetical protein
MNIHLFKRVRFKFAPIFEPQTYVPMNEIGFHSTVIVDFDYAVKSHMKVRLVK